jgi:hypothetical protein
MPRFIVKEKRLPETGGMKRFHPYVALVRPWKQVGAN